MDTFAKDRLPPLSAWPTLTPPPYPERLNAAVELLRDHTGPAVRGDKTWSYDELNTRSDAIAAALRIEPGTRVLLHSANTPEAIAAWLGILRAGGIVVATMPLLRAGELAKVIEKARGTHPLGAARRAGGGRGGEGGRARDARAGVCGSGRLRAGGDRGRRRGDHRLHVGHD